MGTALDSSKVLEFANNALWVALPGTTLPTAPYPTAKPAGWSIVGRVTSDGFTGGQDVNNSKEYDSTGAKAAEFWSELAETLAFTAMETNEIVEALKSPGAMKSSVTPAVAEVQTITITGTPTGGSITPIYRGVPASTTIAYNASATAAQAAVRTIPALASATVTGTGPYVVTLPTSEGNAPLLTFLNSLTGGTAPAVTATETTPGIQGVYQWIENSTTKTTPPLLWWALDKVHVASGLASVTCFAGKASTTDMGAVAKGQSTKTGLSVSKEEDLLIGGLNRVISTLPAHNPALSPGF